MRRVIVFFSAVLGIFWGAIAGRANDIVLVQTNLNTDFVVAGVGGMRGVGSGTITLSGVQGVVTQAYLYWHGPMNTIDPTANADVFVDGQPVVGSNLGFSAPNCWPALSLSQAYRADVTGIVLAKGNGTYELTGFLKPNNVNINGASLLVFYRDNDPDNNRDVVLFHGNDSNFHNSYDADGWNVRLSGITYTPSTNNNARAFIQLHVADGQLFSPNFDDDALRINGVVVAPAGKVFSGDSVPSANNGPKGNGSLWDIKSWEITSLLNPGPNTLSVATGYVDGGDCLSLVLAIVDLPGGSIAPPPTCALLCSTDVTAASPAGQCEVTVSYPLPRVSGTCSGTVVCVPPSGSTFPVGATLVTCSSLDTTCSFNVMVLDKEAPVFDASPDRTQPADPGECTARIDYTVTARDNCPGATYTCTPPSGSAFPVGTATVNCTAADASGNGAKASFKVTVIDTQAPTIIQPADVVKNADSGKTNAVIAFPLPLAQDNCPGVTVACVPPSGSTFPSGTTPVACTATDTANHQAMTHFNVTVTVVDKEKPQVHCPSDIVTTNDVGLCSAVVKYTVTATDNLPGVTVACSSPSGSVFPKGATLVTCNATDLEGNQASCGFLVFVVDVEAPTLAQPADVALPTDPGKTNAVARFDLPAAGDNCPGVTVVCVPPSGSIFPVGVTTVQCTAADEFGNASGKTFRVTVRDDEPPRLVCPDTIVTTNDVGLCSAVVKYTVTATDNLPGVKVACLPPSGSAFPKGTTVVNCTATDVAGSTAACSFLVVVVDVEAPTLAQPADLTLPNDPGKTGAVARFNLPLVQDNCPGVTVACLPRSGSVFPAGVTPVLCTATDEFGNAASRTFRVRVRDDEPPKIFCPDTIVTTNDVGFCSAAVSFTVKVTDDQPGATVLCVPPDGTVFPEGSSVVTCTATDAAGKKARCSFEVLVVDVEPPSLAQPSDIAVSADPGKATATVGFPPPPAADNCLGVAVVSSPPSGSLFRLGTTPVHTTATDQFGNSTLVAFKVTVRDTENPTINCPPDILRTNDAGLCSSVVRYAATATDNVPGVTFACQPPAGSAFPVGVTTVLCTALDTSGNTASCTFHVTVVDGEPPAILCPTSLSVDSDADRCGAAAEFKVTASDNCPGATVACNPPSGSVFPVGDTLVSCTAADAAANTSSCSFTLNVRGASSARFSLTKTANKPLITAGDRVTYTYRVTNTGCETLTELNIVDDNATPTFLSDDFVVASHVTLAPLESQTFTATLIPPVILCSDTIPDTSMGLLLATEMLPSGDIKATLIQATNVNDNTYGLNAQGWGKKGHSFKDLIGGDYAVFTFTDADGAVVLQFRLDYLSAFSGFPSGYGTLGITGGDGRIILGNEANVLSYSTSLTENLNKAPFLKNLAYYTANSPALTDPNSRLWEYRSIYSVVVKRSAFGTVGFGKATVTEQHNSPAKEGLRDSRPTPCSSIVTNTALATAKAGDRKFTNSAQAIVKIGEGCSTCSLSYPYASSNPRTSIAFEESEVLRGFSTQVAKRGEKIKVWYNDEHALALGIRQVVVKTKNGTTATTNFPVTPLSANPGSALRPLVGTTALVGDQAGTDLVGRPMYPALFVTDITLDSHNKSGDWQFGGTAIPPHAVYGTWKAGVKTVDKTRVPERITVDLDADPAINGWNLGAGGPVPLGLKNQRYGAEVQWNVDELGLVPGHTYRLYFMVHDGDQNKTGGDAGQGCLNICYTEEVPRRK